MAITNTGPEGQGKRTGLAALLPYTTVVMLLAAIYAGWTIYSRRQSVKQAQEDVQTKQHEKEKRDADQIFGSGEVKFTVFSADRGHLQRGEGTLLCYGAVNATTLKIDPPVSEPVKPTNRHCVEIKPQKTTTYTLTGSNAKGDTKTSSLTVHVE